MYSQYVCRRQQRKRFLVILFSIIMILSCITNFLHAGEEIAKSQVQRSIVKQLKYIDASKAREYLVNLGIGTDINQLGSMNALIITTDNDQDRMKASALIALIDSKTKFELIRVKVNFVPEKIEDTSSIQAKIEGIVLGTFRNPPVGTESPKAIIDVQSSGLIALVPKGYALPIVAILEDMYHVEADATNQNETGTIEGTGKEIIENDRLISTTTGNEATHEETEFETTVTELANIALDDVNTKDDRLAEKDFINEELLEALTTVEQEIEGKIVTEKTIEKVETEPAVIAEQVVVTETPEKTKAESKVEPASVMLAKSDVVETDPTMAELMAKIEELTKDDIGGVI